MCRAVLYIDLTEFPRLALSSSSSSSSLCSPVLSGERIRYVCIHTYMYLCLYESIIFNYKWSLAIENDGPVSLSIAEANFLESFCFWRLLRSRKLLMNGGINYFMTKKIENSYLFPVKILSTHWFVRVSTNKLTMGR